MAHPIKLLAVSMSVECVKVPRCSFCYRRRKPRHIIQGPWQQEAGTLRDYDAGRWLWNHLYFPRLIGSVLKHHPAETLCMEYNGHNLILLEQIKVWGVAANQCITMTTMPQVVTAAFAGHIKSRGVSAVALSYDTEKCRSWDEWVQAADILRAAGLMVSCNYLLEGRNLDNLPISKIDQLNLLVKKPDGRLSPDMLAYVRSAAVLINLAVPVAVDNCLAVQLGRRQDCAAGREFMHLTYRGDVMPCCFGGSCYLGGH